MQHHFRTCFWSETESQYIDPLLEYADTVTSSGNISADGSGGGSGGISVNVSGPWYKYYVSWSVVNAAGQTIASGSYTSGTCSGNGFYTQWSGSGSAPNSLLKVYVSTRVEAQGNQACTFANGSGEFDHGSEWADSGDCPV